MAKIYENSNEKIWHKTLDDVMSESFGKYAKYIIQDRALPDIRDGLKPVQRRILFAMNELKITYDRQYKKSARTVGEVIGKYHPHGDSSIYEAMVRMSQEWKNTLPLLDMQGNKGSIDGDPPAAMRYTECRLSKFGQALLEDIEKNTIKFIPNFDDSEKEPSILPALLPNILINGATGIAAGYATNIPPFNFNEVISGIIFRIKKPNSTLKEIAHIIKGPDFPTGGTIQGKDEIIKMYETGRGKINIKSTIEEVVRNSNKKNKQLIITEIPFEVNKSSLIKSIDELRVENKLPGLKEVRDDSDKNGISIVLELDTEKDLEIIKNYLYKNTQLQISYPANIVVIKDRKPCLLGIIEILDEYLVHANEIIIKSSQFDLDKFLVRKEILEGLIKCISNLDKLIELIRSSNSKDEAKNKLIDFFKLNEKQAEAVVQLRLYILTSYDTQKLKDEYDQLLLSIKEKEELINNKEVRDNFLIKKLIGYQKMFGVPRRSKIENEIDDIQIEQTDIIEEKNGIAILTRDNYIKFILNTDFDDIDLDKIKIKESDIPIDMFELSTLDNLICLTNKGKLISIPAYKIKITKLKDNGIHINELITIDSYDRTIASFAVSKNSNVDTEIIVATKNGLIKRMKLDEINFTKNSKIISYINLKDNDEVVSAFVVNKNFEQVIVVTENGYSIRYFIDEIPLVGRNASGVKNISLKENDNVISSFPLDPNESFIMVASNRGAKRIHYEDIALVTRCKSGKRVLSQVDSNPYVINSAFMISGRQVLNVLSKSGELVTMKAAEIPISDSLTRMNKYPIEFEEVDKVTLVKLDKNIIPISHSNNFSVDKKENNVAKNTEQDEDFKEIEKMLNESYLKYKDSTLNKETNFNNKKIISNEINSNHELEENNEITSKSNDDFKKEDLNLNDNLNNNDNNQENDNHNSDEINDNNLNDKNKFESELNDNSQKILDDKKDLENNLNEEDNEDDEEDIINYEDDKNLDNDNHDDSNLEDDTNDDLDIDLNKNTHFDEKSFDDQIDKNKKLSNENKTENEDQNNKLLDTDKKDNSKDNNDEENNKDEQDDFDFLEMIEDIDE